MISLKKVLVTGGARGLGKSICQMFDKHGYMVLINYNNSEKEAEKLKFELNNALIFKADVSNEVEVRNMFDKIHKEVGNIDCVVNNAGICIDNELELKTSEEFMNVLKVNLLGSYLVCKYAKNIINNGSIINVSSNNIYTGSYIESVDYDASKSGIVSLTHNFAKEYAPYIRVNALAPGWINTSMNKDMNPLYELKEKNKILLERFADPDEIADAVYFLHNNTYINDCVLKIDGGIR